MQCFCRDLETQEQEIRIATVMKSKRLLTSISDTKLHCSFSVLFAPEISSVVLTISSSSTQKSHFFWRNTCGYWSNQKQSSKQLFWKEWKIIVSILSTWMEQRRQENKLFIWKEIAFTDCFIAMSWLTEKPSVNWNDCPSINNMFASKWMKFVTL